jgi:outer membrane protein assembly factor BamB
VISDGKAILAMDNGYVVAELWALSVDSGEREKLFKIGDRRNVSGVMRGYRLIANPLAATPKTVYFPTHVDPENSQKGPRNHVLHAVDAKTGTERWSYSFEASPRAPAVTDSAIYVPNGGQLFILDPEDGTYVTSVQLGNQIDPPMAVTSDRVYVTDKAGVLYALGK